MTQASTSAALVAKPTERTVAEEGRTIFQALVNVCGGVENVKKDTTGQVGNTKYKYATLDAVLEITQPLLKENGLALIQFVSGDNLVNRLVHESGETMFLGEYNLGSFIDSQKRGSAITYARRYTLCSIFGIAQEDDDGAADSNKKPVATPKKSDVFSTKTDRNKFETRLVAQMEAAPDLGELRAIWDEAMPVLAQLKTSDNDDDSYSYAHLLKMKDMVKGSIMAVSNGNEDFLPH